MKSSKKLTKRQIAIENAKSNRNPKVYDLGRGIILITFERKIHGSWTPCISFWSTPREVKGVHYRFNSKSERLEWLNRKKKFFKNDIKAQEKREAEWAKERKEFLKKLKIGSILCGSWGWEQTNWSFFEVVEIKGTQTLGLRELRNIKHEETGWLTYEEGPATGEDRFQRDEVEYRRIIKGMARVNGRYGTSLSLWKGDLKTATHYA